MTPIDLVDELVKFLKGVVKEYDLSTKIEGINKAPSVYAGYLPPKNRVEDEKTEQNEQPSLTPNDYPFVIVRFLTDTSEVNKDDSDITNIRILIGTHSEDDQNGWRDPLNIATRIKMELNRVKSFGAFSLTDKIQTELFEEQLRPFWHAIMDLSFNIPQIQQEIDWSEGIG